MGKLWWNNLTTSMIWIQWFYKLELYALFRYIASELNDALSYASTIFTRLENCYWIWHCLNIFRSVACPTYLSQVSVDFVVIFIYSFEIKILCYIASPVCSTNIYGWIRTNDDFRKVLWCYFSLFMWSVSWFSNKKRDECVNDQVWSNRNK